MPSAHALRTQIEAALKDKIPAALSLAPRVVRFATPTGIAALDRVLGGGLPSAAITELVGSSCSGRTTAGLAYLSSLTLAGNVCAWIDVDDTFDPESAAANGVDLERLLWVRCGNLRVPSPMAHDASENVACGGVSSVPLASTGGSPHPRSEGHGMPQAITAMLHAHGGLHDQQTRREKKMVGTPGAPNRPLAGRSEQREEQVNSDRLPARRGDNLTLSPRCAEPQARRLAGLSADGSRPEPPSSASRDTFTSRKPLRSLDHALRAADLLLQGGGFSAIVLDLGSLSPEMAWRVPLATWFRFRAACERTRVSLLLLTQHPCARSSAELVVRMETGIMESESKVMTGVRYRTTAERSRPQEQDGRVISIRKPPQSVRPDEWKSGVAWTRAK